MLVPGSTEEVLYLRWAACLYLVVLDRYRLNHEVRMIATDQLYAPHLAY
nr:hypothetical protein Q903MT_gene6202 [Picea sitchensis]